MLWRCWRKGRLTCGEEEEKEPASIASEGVVEDQVDGGDGDRNVGCHLRRGDDSMSVEFRHILD